MPPDWTVAGAAPWEVHRRWVTRLGRENVGRRFGRRLRNAPDHLDVADGGCFSGIDDLIVGIVFVVVVILLIVFVAPLVIFAVELLLLFVALILGLVARIVFRRPWAVDAFARDGTHLRWKAVGWRATTARVDEVTAALSHGVIPPGAELLHTDAVTARPAPPPDWDPRQGPFGSGS
ncbi:MAG TPA: hypothetical protein VF228_07090 [Iamia sp.]